MLSSSPIVSRPVAFSGGTITGDTTIASAKALAVTTADKLTVGGVIVPQAVYVNVPLFVTDLTKSVFVATEALQVTAVKAVYGVVSLSGTMALEKLTGTTAPGSGSSMLTGALDLTTTANTVLSGTLTGTTANLQLAAGDRIGCVLGGTLTGLLGCVLTIALKRI